jgi:hypothetical protein
MATPKWKGGVAVVRASSATHEPASGFVYPMAESAQIEGAPILYTRLPYAIPDPDRVGLGGFEFSWRIDGITPNCMVFGYLMALALGNDSWNGIGGYHSLRPDDDAQYLNVLIDRGLDLGTSEPTERLVGAKITGWTLEFKHNEYAKLSVSGVGANLGSLAAALAPSIPTGDDDEPLGWHHLRNGYVRLGYNGGAVADDNDITGFTITYNRPPILSGRDLGSAQPTEIFNAARELTFSITKEFSGSGAVNMYNAWKNQQEVEFTWRAEVGSAPNYVSQASVYGYVSRSFAGEVGAGEDVIEGTLECLVYKKGTDDLIKFDVKDGTTGAYW